MMYQILLSVLKGFALYSSSLVFALSHLAHTWIFAENAKYFLHIYNQNTYWYRNAAQLAGVWTGRPGEKTFSTNAHQVSRL